MQKHILRAAREFTGRTALILGSQRVTYGELAAQSLAARTALQDLGVKKGDRVCLFGEKTPEYVAIQLALWRVGAIAITLLPSYPAAELEHYVMDSDAKLIISSDTKKSADVVHIVRQSKLKTVTPGALLPSGSQRIQDESFGDSRDVNLKDGDPACLIYTSGSTSKPKGVVTTHAALEAMVKGMVQAWEWTRDDSILHFLPLHHVHGHINKLLTPLSVGARVEFVEFDAANTLTRLNDSDESRRPSVFMAVPTVYAKLAEQWEKQGKPELREMKKLRLFVCGSAPLPVVLFNKFKAMSGQNILERWGMTEVGMGLSNPLRPPEKRLPGFVGTPMPGVEVKLVDLDDEPNGSVLVPKDQPGDLLIRGTSVFKTYWGKAAPLTASEFTVDGWFKTGDVAVFDSKEESYKIVGRKSVDVIKSGGFKISALEIEKALLDDERLLEVAVLGIPDDVWGESVVAIVVPKHGQTEQVTEQSVQAFAARHLVKYKIPRRVLVMQSIPKNAMGKVNKKGLKGLFVSK